MPRHSTSSARDTAQPVGCPGDAVTRSRETACGWIIYVVTDRWLDDFRVLPRNLCGGAPTIPARFAYDEDIMASRARRANESAEGPMRAWIGKDSELVHPARPKVLFSQLLALIVPLIACTWNCTASAQEAASRTIPSRIIPIPAAASPDLQKLLAQPANPGTPPPRTTEGWRALAEQFVPDRADAEQLAKMSNQLGVTVVPRTMGGVRCYVATPTVIQPRNRNRVLLNLHPGGFIAGAVGRYGTEWAVKIASLMGYKVI